MAIAILPDGTVKVLTTEAYGRFKMDDNFTPHVTMERAKMRVMAFKKGAETLPTSVNGTWTEERILLTHIPAGRTRVLWNTFTLINIGTAAMPSAQLELGSYISNLPNDFEIKPAEVITTTALAPGVDSVVTITTQIPAKRLIGEILTTKEDIALCLKFASAQTLTTLASIAFFGQFVYLQE